MAIDPSVLILGAGAALGFYMAWNIGANDVANSMSTAVGAHAITLKQAVILAGILNIVGAVFIGGHVTATVSRGVVSPEVIGSAGILVAGMLATLLASGLWVTLATWKAMPVSTTHSVIGALVGFGLVASGTSAINWVMLSDVVASWFLSPVLGAIISYLVFRSIVWKIFNSADRIRSAVYYSPVIVGSTFLIITASLLLKTPLGQQITGDTIALAIMISLVVAIICGRVGFVIIYRKSRFLVGTEGVETIFRKLQIMTSCYVALSHGANDVANAVGPLAAIFTVQSSGSISGTYTIPVYLLVLGGLGIMIGIFTWGYKVIKTVAFRITKITNTRGFSVDFGVATTVLLASKLGMPISTTHTAIGAVVGVGLARGLAGVDLRVIRNIVVSWLITLPIAALTSAAVFILLRGVI